MGMQTVSDLLNSKGRTVHVAAPDTPLMNAARRMRREGIGALVVCEDSAVIGILSERDIVDALCQHDEEALEQSVASVMSHPVQSVGGADSLEACMALMTDRRCRHLPVLEEGHLVGIVSIGDLVKATLDHQRFLIAQLETYIAGP
jgi:CBS domain-containing protein